MAAGVVVTLAALGVHVGLTFYEDVFGPEPDDCYTALVEARDTRHRIMIVNRVSGQGASQQCLHGFARYWMDETDYLDSQPTLWTLLTSAIKEGGYHDPAFQDWVVEDLARSDNADYRNGAWVFLGGTDWRIDEKRLLEAIELENQEVAAGRQTTTNWEMTLHCIAKIGRRLYPASDWWQPLIQERYGK